MTFMPGVSGNPAGKPVGALSKVSRSAKEALTLAFEGIGGLPALETWARDPANRGAFYSLWGKMIPKAIEASGLDGGELVVTIVRK